jgi:cell division control protein 6
VEKAFRPGAVLSEVIEQIAEHVAEKSGDCRKALQKLLEAGRKAEVKDLANVSKVHINNEREY